MNWKRKEKKRERILKILMAMVMQMTKRKEREEMILMTDLKEKTIRMEATLENNQSKMTQMTMALMPNHQEVVEEEVAAADLQEEVKNTPLTKMTSHLCDHDLACLMKILIFIGILLVP